MRKSASGVSSPGPVVSLVIVIGTKQSHCQPDVGHVEWSHLSPNYKYDYTCHPACHYNHPTTIRNIQENHINGNGWCVVCGVISAIAFLWGELV